MEANKAFNLSNVISVAIRKDASDIHFNNGKVFFRVNGAIEDFSPDPFYTDEDIEAALLILLSNRERAILAEKGDVDVSYRHISGINCRVNVFQDNNGISISIRIVKSNIPTIQDLHIPFVMEKLTDSEHGLILVCGPTGAGKSTTIATLINKINSSRSEHIITIEDPIEYIFPRKLSVVSQREIGHNCQSFHQGLKAALRQDPDIILVGELRDKETIETALSAAETGHLVFSTLHAGSSAEAIDRLTHYFPAEQQQQIRYQLTLSFLGIITQKLCPAKKGGRVAAFEILVNNTAISHVIRKNELNTLRNYMTAATGMQTMDDALKDLQQRNII